MANEIIKDDDILDAECLKLFSPSNKMTEKQFKKVLEYLNGCVLKKTLETSNEIQRLVILKYLQDESISEEEKQSSMGEENYKQWKLLVMEAQNRISNISKDRENNPNLRVEVNNNGGQSSTKVETDEKEENIMENNNAQNQQQQEKGLWEKAKENAAPIAIGIGVGVGGKMIYDHFTKPDASYGSVTGDMVETVSAFTDEF